MFRLASLTTATVALLVQSSSLFAQTTGPATQSTTSEPGWVGLLRSPMVLPVVLLVLLYVFIFSSKRKQDKKKREALDTLKRGDEIQTIGGILGKIVETKTDRVLVKVDESNNTKVWFSRSAIHKVLTEDKADKAEATK